MFLVTKESGQVNNIGINARKKENIGFLTKNENDVRNAATRSGVSDPAGTVRPATLTVMRVIDSRPTGPRTVGRARMC